MFVLFYQLSYQRTMHHINTVGVDASTIDIMDDFCNIDPWGAREMSRGPFAPKLKSNKCLIFNFGAKGPLDISFAPALFVPVHTHLYPKYTLYILHVEHGPLTSKINFGREPYMPTICKSLVSARWKREKMTDKS